jgi:hypothetical protein
MTPPAAVAAHRAGMDSKRTETTFADSEIGDTVVVVPSWDAPEIQFTVDMVGGSGDARWLADSNSLRYYASIPWRIYRIDVANVVVSLERVDQSIETFRKLLGTTDSDSAHFYDAAREVLDFADRARAAGIQ